MRIFFQIVIGLVALVIGIAAIGVTTAWWAVGTPSHAASTVAATVTSTEGALGVGDMLLSTVLDSASPDERAVIEQRRDELVAAAAQALEGQQVALQAIVTAALTAITDGVKVDIDPTPVTNAVMAKLHAADSEIPDHLDSTDGSAVMTIDGTSADLAALSGVFKGLGLWWVALLVLAIVLVLDALVGRRGGMRRWLIPSIFLAVPGLLWLVLSFTAPGAVSGFSDNAYQAGLIKAGVSSVSTKLMVVSLIVVVIAVVLFVLSLTVRGSRQEVAAVAAGPGADEAPVPAAPAPVQPPDDGEQTPLIQR